MKKLNMLLTLIVLTCAGLSFTYGAHKHHPAIYGCVIGRSKHDNSLTLLSTRYKHGQVHGQRKWKTLPSSLIHKKIKPGDVVKTEDDRVTQIFLSQDDVPLFNLDKLRKEWEKLTEKKSVLTNEIKKLRESSRLHLNTSESKKRHDRIENLKNELFRKNQSLRQLKEQCKNYYKPFKLNRVKYLGPFKGCLPHAMKKYKKYKKYKLWKRKHRGVGTYCQTLLTQK